MKKKRGIKGRTGRSRKTGRNAKTNKTGKSAQPGINAEKIEEQELQELERLKRDVEKKSGLHPLTKITRADIVRSIIGALIGTVGHFAFFYGAELAERISMVRATSLYLLSIIVCFLFMYYSGFRKVKEIRIFRFIPLRVGIVYITSILVVMGTLFVFGFIDIHTTFADAYKTVATTLLLAVLGACTADILGKE
ncbi:MAG: hypothetical protein AB1668_01190 [Nanoarchaeota archaeon]